MPFYIGLGRWTEQGVKNAKDSPKRVATAKALIEKSGGKFHGIYYTMGEYDFVILAEGPSDEIISGNVLAIAGQGSVRLTTMRAFTLEEAEKIFAKLP